MRRHVKPIAFMVATALVYGLVCFLVALIFEPGDWFTVAATLLGLVVGLFASQYAVLRWDPFR